MFSFCRPCIGSELYIFHANSCHRDEILVKSGDQLPLNLCIQLKNASKKKCASIPKIYCVLAVRAADRFTDGSGRLAPVQCVPQTHKAEDTLWLSEIYCFSSEPIMRRQIKSIRMWLMMAAF